MSGSVGVGGATVLRERLDRVGDELRAVREAHGVSLLEVQHDLKIRGAYLEAIEASDAGVFPNRSFASGYVRSYARYMGFDPDEVLRRFVQESDFDAVHRAREAAARSARGTRAATTGTFRPDFPLAEPRRSVLAAIPFGAIGSVCVIAALVGGLGYGGWTLLQDIQRVEFAPVEDVPQALAESPQLPVVEPGAGPVLPDLAAPVAATALADLYRRQELEVPILVPRDGPIAAIDPDRSGLMARAEAEPAQVPAERYEGSEVADLISSILQVNADAAPNEPQVTVPPERKALSLVAERPAWVRVYYPNGTVIFERILESGEVYEVPETEEPAMIWAGNSGSVYVSVGGELHGPIGVGTRAARDVPLDPAVISERFNVVADVPSVIAESLSATNPVLLQ